MNEDEKVAIVGCPTEYGPKMSALGKLALLTAAAGMPTLVDDAIDQAISRVPKRDLFLPRVPHQGAKEKARRLRQLARRKQEVKG